MTIQGNSLNPDYIVIGAGALGLASATALLQQGAKVTVLESGAVGQESSWAGGGILSPLSPWDYPEPVTRLALRGMAQFEQYAADLLQQTGIDPEYQRCGMLVLPPCDLTRAAEWCAAHGMRIVPRDGGVFLPDIAQARNPRLLKSLRARVTQLGGRIVEQCAVQGLAAVNDSVQHLHTNHGEFRAAHYVVTAGAWSRTLLGEYALQAEIKPIRGQMLLFKFDAPPFPHIVLQDGLYLIPRRDGNLLVGSTLEDVGFDKSTNDAVQAMLRQRAEALLPALRGMPVVRHWAGLRPGSPGNLPTIGRHPSLRNLYLNSGHFRYGVTMAPASVEVLLNEIFGRPQALDVTPYRWQ